MAMTGAAQSFSSTAPPPRRRALMALGALALSAVTKGVNAGGAEDMTLGDIEKVGEVLSRVTYVSLDHFLKP